ncbi:MAG: hypothetical protein BGO39_20735 [Chloroflexi bacterium 54-19]|nr:MAG: hypothetical protein BGO39_20735 [Chloroflexi bacterium 54-19]
MRLQIEELRHLDSLLAANARQLNAAPHYNNISEAYSLTHDLSIRADKLQSYLEVIEYWSNLLEIALKAHYVPQSLLTQFDSLRDQAQSVMDGTTIATAATFNEAETALAAAGQFVINLSAESCKVAIDGAVKHTSLLDNAVNWLAGRINEAENLILQLVSKLIDSFRQAIGEAASILKATGSFLEELGGRIKESFSIAILETSVDFLDGGLKVVEWLSDTTWVKNLGVWVGRFAKILTLTDEIRYLSGNMTNQEIVENLVKDFIPIPIINEWAGEYIGQYTPDPDGHFQLIAPAGGDIADGANIRPGDWAKPLHTDPVPLDKFLTGKLQESFNTAVNVFHNSVSFIKNTAGFAWDTFQDTTKAIFESAKESFLIALDAASKALIAGFDKLGHILLNPYIKEVGPAFQKQLRAEGIDQPDYQDRYDSWSVKAEGTIPVLGELGVKLSGDVKITRRREKRDGRWVEVLTIEGEREAGVATSLDEGVEGSLTASNKVAIEMVFDEDSTEDMGKLSILMETLGVKDGKLNTFYNAAGPAIRGGGGIAELALYRNNITKVEGDVGVNAEVGVGIDYVANASVSGGMGFGTALIKDKDGNWNPAYTLSMNAGAQSELINTAAGINIETSATIGTEKGEINSSEVSLKISASSDIDLVSVLVQKGVTASAAIAIADKLKAENFLSPLKNGIKQEVELKFKADNIKGKVKDPLNALNYALQNGSIEADFTSEQDSSLKLELAGNGVIATQGKGQTDKIIIIPGEQNLPVMDPAPASNTLPGGNSIPVSSQPAVVPNSEVSGGGSRW